MRTNDEQLTEADAPLLRVYGGEEGAEDGDYGALDPNLDALREWARTETFWAGRNRAKRRSARLAA